jgi:phosphomannomutase/phosphoglucomutase
MRESSALLGGEMSGHFFFKERWYGFDDALYSAARLLELIAANPEKNVSAIFEVLPNSVNTPEINIDISEEKKFSFIENVKKHPAFQLGTLITVDGVRVEFQDGWGLIRASNTTPCLVLRFEADSSNALARIQREFKEAILFTAPELEVPF